MNQQDNLETNNESIIIEDLSAQNAEEIKGGPSKGRVYSDDVVVDGRIITAEDYWS